MIESMLFVVVGSREASRLMATDDVLQNIKVLGAGETARLTVTVLGFRCQGASFEEIIRLCPHNTWWRDQLLDLERKDSE